MFANIYLCRNNKFNKPEVNGSSEHKECFASTLFLVRRAISQIKAGGPRERLLKIKAGEKQTK
jgi:hypothetical protein